MICWIVTSRCAVGLFSILDSTTNPMIAFFNRKSRHEAQCISHNTACSLMRRRWLNILSFASTKIYFSFFNFIHYTFHKVKLRELSFDGFTQKCSVFHWLFLLHSSAHICQIKKRPAVAFPHWGIYLSTMPAVSHRKLLKTFTSQ